MQKFPTTSDFIKFQKNNPQFFSETFIDKERRETEEQKQASLSNIEISTPAPIQETPDPISFKLPEKYLDPEYLNSVELSNTISKQIDSRKDIYDSPAIQKIREYGNLQNNLSLERDKSKSVYEQSNYNMKDLDKDDVYQEVGKRYLRSLGSNENLYENLRDAKYSIGDAVALAMKSDNWSDQTKADYAYLKQIFDNANTESVEHILKATKDIAIDLVFDIPNLLAVPFIVSTGGVGGVALSGAAKFGATQAFRQGAKKASLEFAKNKTLRTASIGLTEGAYDAGVIGVSNQLSDIQTGIRQNFSVSEAVGMTAAGAVLGGGAAAGLTKLGNFLNKRELNKFSDETGLAVEDLQKAKPEQIKEWRESLRQTDRILGLITGKATTPFKEFAKGSETVEEFLTNIRHDAMRRVFDAGPEAIAKVSFGSAVSKRQAEYTLLFQKAMAQLDGKYGKIDVQDNSDILYLIGQDINLDNHVKLTKFNKKGINQYKIIEPIIVDGREISPQAMKAAKGIKEAFNKVFNDGFNLERVGGSTGGTKFDLFRNISQRVANYFPRHWSIEAIKEKRAILENMLVKSRHTDMRLERMTDEGIEELNLDDGVTRYTIDVDADGKMIEDSISKLDPEVRQYINVNELTIDQKVFGNVINPKTNKPYLERYNGFEDMALESLKKKYNLNELQVNVSTQKDLLRLRPDLKDEFDLTARKFKAQVIVQDLINKADPKYKNIQGEMRALGSNTFMKERAFDDLSDTELHKYGFVNTDVQTVLSDYALSMGKSIEKARYFGRSDREFNDRFIIPIMNELENSNIKFNESDLVDNLTKLYKVTAGVEDNVPVSKNMRAFGDVLKVSQQLAHLGFATLSSITEPLIAVSRADLPDASALAVEFAKAGAKQIKKSFIKASDRVANLTGKRTRLFKELDDEEMYDTYQAGLAMENAVMDRIEGMYGEGLQTGVAKKISNFFFTANLLTPWTQAVQMGAYKFGQQKVIRILGELNDNTNFYGSTLSKKGKQRRIDQLAEIGIDSNQALIAYKSNIDADGNLDELAFRQSKFFDDQISPATALFAREIILNPTAAEGNKPLWMSNYYAQIFVQFAGYPTAFNNTVLKGMARNMIRDPVANVPKVLAATTMMTGVASITNALRSEGRSLEQEPTKIMAESIRRWGGFGPYEYIHKYLEGAKYGGRETAAALKAPLGPIPADLIDAIVTDKNLAEILITNLPGYSSYPKEVRDAFKKWAREYGKETKYEAKDYRSFAEGGEVTEDNPDDVYSFLTKDENEYNSEDVTPIALHTEDTLPTLDIKDTFYIDLKGFTVADKLDAYRKSDTIGVPVYKARGRGNVAGKIKFNKLLDLDVANAEIEAVQESITKNKDDIIYTDDFIANEIIKETNYQLTLRDDVLADDPNKTPAKEDLIKRSKSFLVRNEILKLGYDAIKTKEGYTLLRENQFLPTEIIDRRQQVFLGGLLKRIGTGIGKFLGALKRRSIGTYNRTQTKVEDIQKQAALIGGPGQAVPRSLITKEKEVLPELFKDKLIQSESSGNYKATKVAPKNQNLYVGAYQFGDARLKDYRRATKEQFTMDEFKESRELQDKVFDWHINDIRKGIKRNKLDQYIGQRINNIPITEPGMVAAAHLGGFTGMKRFITLLGEPYYDKDYWEKYQKLKPSDADDGVTYLSDYLDKFKDTRFEREQYSAGSKVARLLVDLVEEALPPPKKTEALDMLNNPSKVDEWKANNKVPKEESKRRKARKFPEQATAVEEGTMSGKEYRTYLKENQPAATFSEEDLNTMMPDFSQVVGALDKNKSEQGILGLNSKLKKGERTTARLDIPAYNDYDTWVTSMTQKGQKYYGRTGVLSEVSFDMFLPGQKKAALDIAKGKVNKFPYATMKGTWEDLTDEQAFALAKKYINDPEWTQVGFNPERASYFYDKKTMLPVFDAELVIQIGPLVLAKQKKLTPARSLERMLKIRKLRMETRAEGARPAIFNKGGEVTLEQKQKRYNLNKKYLEEIHNYSIANKATGLDDEGKTISMATSSLGTAADKHYIINKWNPYTKKLEDDSLVLKRIESLVKEGKIIPYSTPKEAEDDRRKMRTEILNIKQQQKE